MVMTSDSIALVRGFGVVLGLDADHLPALTRLAAIRTRQGDRAGARQALRRALELAPERDDLRQELAALGDG